MSEIIHLFHFKRKGCKLVHLLPCIKYYCYSNELGPGQRLPEGQLVPDGGLPCRQASEGGGLPLPRRTGPAEPVKEVVPRGLLGQPRHHHALCRTVSQQPLEAVSEAWRQAPLWVRCGIGSDVSGTHPTGKSIQASLFMRKY